MKRIEKEGAQGDVYFRRVEALPDGAENVTPKGDIIVAHSETGHHHVAVGTALAMYMVAAEVQRRYLVAQGDVQIEHHREYDTHETVSLRGSPDGNSIWEVTRQREWTPDGWRQVED